MVENDDKRMTAVGIRPSFPVISVYELWVQPGETRADFGIQKRESQQIYP
jgi:hypothetical protein